MPRSPAIWSEYDRPLDLTLTLDDLVLLEDWTVDELDEEDFTVVVDCLTTFVDEELLELELLEKLYDAELLLLDCWVADCCTAPATC
jgi:adenosyl cobinamide kinase/adenosyl cobinamide phosphate guanylyltransferase